MLSITLPFWRQTTEDYNRYRDVCGSRSRQARWYNLREGFFRSGSMDNCANSIVSWDITFTASQSPSWFLHGISFQASVFSSWTPSMSTEKATRTGSTSIGWGQDWAAFWFFFWSLLFGVIITDYNCKKPDIWRDIRWLNLFNIHSIPELQAWLTIINTIWVLGMIKSIQKMSTMREITLPSLQIGM